MPKPVREMELSRPVSVPVTLVSFLLFVLYMQQVTNQALFSDSSFLFPVITGKVTSLAPGPRGTLIIGVSLIKAYKADRLTITQVGEAMSVKLVSQCKKCPVLRRGRNSSTLCLLYIHNRSVVHPLMLIFFSVIGANYIIMGQVDEDGRGTLAPGVFTAPYKAPHHKLLANIQNQPC